MVSTDLLLLLVLCAVVVSSFKLMKSTDDGGLQCVAEGRFAHPDFCDEYVDCIPEGESRVLKAYSGSCRGGVFDTDVKKCLSPGKKDSNCTTSRRNARAIAFDPDYDFICEDGKSEFFCHSCKTLVKCVNGRAYLDNCGSGHTCDMRVEFGGGVCYPNSPAECSCRNERELLPDFYSEVAYLECQAGDLEPNVQFCKKDMIFKTDVLMCEYPQGYVECTKHGVFPNPDDCTQYYKCMPVARGLIQYTFSCACGLVFNDLTGECEDPCSYQSKEFTCEVEGRFPDEYDCHKFFLCIADSSVESGFLQSHHTCPQQSFWKPGEIEGIGSCQISRDYFGCTSMRVPKCGVPDGRDCTITPTLISGAGECVQDSPNCQCNSATGELFCEDGYTSNGLYCRPIDDTCGGVTCDINAQCSSDVCECLDPYVGNGLACNLPPPDGTCGGVTCDVNAQCSSDVCECQDPYVGNGLACNLPAPANGVAFMVYQGPATHAQALTACVGHGGRLAVPQNRDQNEEIYLLIKDFHEGFTSYWIGIDDKEEEGIWVNSNTGMPATYTDFSGHRGEPNNAFDDEHCAEMITEHDESSWNDINCNNELFGYVCEFDE